MKRSAYFSLVVLVAMFALTSMHCDKQAQDTPPAVAITIAANGPAYPGAKIQFDSPKPDEVLADDSVGVTVDLTGFDVAVPTVGDANRGLAYSKQDSAKPDMPFGQHVHIIVDNEPYMACYVKDKPFWIPKRLTPGMHTLRVFPSRSWHESVKQPECFAMETFYVKSKTGTPVDWTKPFLTYSRPKGEYSGAGTKQIMVDFYVSNCELGEGKYTAKISVDGATSLTATSWCPYMITGLTPGPHTVSVTLVAPDGTPVEGAWNSTMRTIIIK